MIARIRNGINLDAPLIRARAAAPSEAPTIADTEWTGGVESATTLQQGAGEDEASFVVRCDDTPDASGNNTAPNPTGLMAAAIAADMIRELAIEAALTGVTVETLSVQARLDSGAAGGEEVECTLALTIEADAPPARIESLAVSAAQSAPVLRMLRSPPKIIITQLGDGFSLEPATA